MSESISREDYTVTNKEGRYAMTKQMMEAIKEVLLSEDNTGCSPDLTVVSMKAIEQLRKEYEKEMKQEKGKEY
jgi:hypothetical protein